MQKREVLDKSRGTLLALSPYQLYVKLRYVFVTILLTFQILQCCFKLGIPEITIFAFSIENFSRPQEEIDDLFELLTTRLSVLINADESVFRKLRIRVKIIGNKALLPENIAKELYAVEEKSLFPDSQKTLNICTPYTSRDDIANSIRAIAVKRKSNAIAKEDINAKVLGDNMYFGLESRPLDILIRTSGHYRLSDFLLWQCTSNCTIEFVSTLWPDFKFLSLYLTLLKWGYHKQLEVNDKKIYKPSPKAEPKFVDISMLPQSPPFATIMMREAPN